MCFGYVFGVQIPPHKVFRSLGVAPEKWSFEYYFPLGVRPKGQHVSFREGKFMRIISKSVTSEKPTRDSVSLAVIQH